MEFLYQWQARELYRLLVYQHLCSDYIDFIDHNCRPSAYVRVDGDNIVLKAIEKIASEADEITIDYNCSEYSLAESFECRCCHPPNRIRGYRYLMRSDQRDYLRHISPFLLHTSRRCSRPIELGGAA